MQTERAIAYLQALLGTKKYDIKVGERGQLIIDIKNY